MGKLILTNSTSPTCSRMNPKFGKPAHVLREKLLVRTLERMNDPEAKDNEWLAKLLTQMIMRLEIVSESDSKI